MDKDGNDELSGWYVNGKESAGGIVLIEEGALPWLGVKVEPLLPPLDGVQTNVIPSTTYVGFNNAASNED